MTRTRAVTSAISLCDRRRTRIARQRGVPLALAAPASAKKGRVVRIGRGPSSEFGKSRDTNVALSLLTQPARSRARPAREYASKTGHTKTKHRTPRTNRVGGCAHLPPADRSAALPSARSSPLTQGAPCEQTKADAAAIFDAASAAVPLKPRATAIRRSRARAIRASAVGRAASVGVSSSRLESTIFVLASGSRPLSHHCREHRRTGSRK